MKQESKATTKKFNDAQEKLKLYSIQLSEQAGRISEIRAQISELEAQLNYRAQVIEELRAQLAAVSINQSNKEAFDSTSALGDPTSVDLPGAVSLIALPEQVPVGRTVGSTEITWDTGDGSEGDVYVSVDGEP